MSTHSPAVTSNCYLGAHETCTVPVCQCTCSSPKGCKRLAAELGVTHSTIQAVRKGRTWV